MRHSLTHSGGEVIPMPQRPNPEMGQWIVLLIALMAITVMSMTIRVLTL